MSRRPVGDESRVIARKSVMCCTCGKRWLCAVFKVSGLLCFSAVSHATFLLDTYRQVSDTGVKLPRGESDH